MRSTSTRARGGASVVAYVHWLALRRPGSCNAYLAIAMKGMEEITDWYCMSLRDTVTTTGQSGSRQKRTGRAQDSTAEGRCCSSSLRDTRVPRRGRRRRRLQRASRVGRRIDPWQGGEREQTSHGGRCFFSVRVIRADATRFLGVPVGAWRGSMSRSATGTFGLISRHHQRIDDPPVIYALQAASRTRQEQQYSSVLIHHLRRWGLYVIIDITIAANDTTQRIITPGATHMEGNFFKEGSRLVHAMSEQKRR